MSFRRIRPSFGVESSTSISNPSQSTSESTGSDPSRQLHPSSSTTGPESGNVTSGSSKRRRVPESVTRNACVNCKKARAKCDGKTPCTRCATRVEGTQCVYEVHIKHAKEELIKQIKDLRTKDHLTEKILTTLSQSTSDQIPGILQRLRNGDSYAAIVEWLGHASVEDYDGVSPRESQQSTFEQSDHEMSGLANAAFRWTVVTTDTAIFDHLFQLYFAWVHPVHTLFSEGHFVESYKRPSPQFCSSALVNAICALSCHLHTYSESDEIDFEQLGQRFSEAARLTLDPNDESLITAQAFAVMFLVDSAQGRCLRGAGYLKISSQMLLTINIADYERFPEVTQQTFRGIRSLNIEWAQVTFQIPNLPHPLPFEPIDDGDKRLDDPPWYFYRDPSDECPEWPGLLATTNREKAKLIEIINEVVSMHYSPYKTHIQARDVCQAYSKLVSWWEALPAVIGNVEDNSAQALPHVLSLLILHSTAVSQLLRPLLDLRGFPKEEVQQLVWNNAQQGLFLLNEHYRKQYTTRYQPVLQMFSTLHLCDVIARFFPDKLADEGSAIKDGPTAIQVGLETLMMSRKGFPVAGPFQEMLKDVATKCGVRNPHNLEDLITPPRHTRADYRLDDFIDACTRATFVQPVAEIQMKYSSSFTADWALEASRIFGSRESARSEEERGAQNLMQIRNLLNMN